MGNGIQILDDNGKPYLELMVQGLIRNGQGFIASTGLFSSGAGTNNYPLSVFNLASSGKNILIYQLRAVTGTGSCSGLMAFTTADPVYGTVATVTNAKRGGSVSVIAANCTWTSTTQTAPATPAQVEIDTKTVDMLVNGAGILLPVGANNGVSLFLQTYAAGLNSITAKWVEF